MDHPLTTQPGLASSASMSLPASIDGSKGIAHHSSNSSNIILPADFGKTPHEDSSTSAKRMAKTCMSSVVFAASVAAPLGLTLYTTTSWALSIEWMFLLPLMPAILCSLVAAILTRFHDHYDGLQRERILEIPIVNFFYATFFCVCPDLDHIVQVLDLIILSNTLMVGCVFTMLTALEHEELQKMDEMWHHGEYSCVKLSGQSFGEGSTMAVSEYLLAEFVLSMSSFLFGFMTALLIRTAAITLPQETSSPDEKTLKAWWVTVRPLIFVAFTLTLTGLVAAMFMAGGLVLIKFPQRQISAWCENEGEVEFRDIWLVLSLDMLDAGRMHTPLNHFGVHIMVFAFIAIYGGMTCLGYAARRAHGVFSRNKINRPSSMTSSSDVMVAKANKAFDDLETCRDALSTCCQLLQKLAELNNKKSI